MKTDAQIRSHVMRRVYAMYWTRQLARPAPRVFALAVLGTVLVSSVSVANIAANVWAVRGAGSLVTFAIAAFQNTTPLVQGLSVAIVSLLSWFSVDGFKQAQLALSPPEAEAVTVN